MYRELRIGIAALAFPYHSPWGPLQADSFGKKLLRFDFYAVHRILIQQAPPLQLLQQPRVEVACNLFRGAQAVIEIYFYKGGVGEDFRYDKINEKSSHH